jgi:hypothetical protein
LRNPWTTRLRREAVPIPAIHGMRLAQTGKDVGKFQDGIENFPGRGRTNVALALTTTGLTDDGGQGPTADGELEPSSTNSSTLQHDYS